MATPTATPIPASSTAVSTYSRPLAAGALAGMTVDIALYPLDTIKTRLQSSRGFVASGGFSGVYRGLGSVVLGSAPGGALFFTVYESVKGALARRGHGGEAGAGAGEHMLAASLGEVAACAVRVPTEVVKQRAQAVQAPSSMAALVAILEKRRTVPGHGVPGVWRELYRGWTITIFREVPFTAVQFPLWEWLKAWGIRRRTGSERGDILGQQATGVESAVFGCLSGGVAAAATTPLDVLKTRMMLAAEKPSLAALTRDVWKNEGSSAFFRGLGPRVAWISIGGAVFLGSYQWAFNMLGGSA